MLKRNGHSATFLKMKKLSHKSMPLTQLIICMCTIVKVVEDVSTVIQYAPSSNGISFSKNICTEAVLQISYWDKQVSYYGVVKSL